MREAEFTITMQTGAVHEFVGDLATQVHTAERSMKAELVITYGPSPRERSAELVIHTQYIESTKWRPERP